MVDARSKESKTRKSEPKKSQKSKKRLFSGMGYREVQRSNARRRGELKKSDRALLKAQGYKNLGWDHVTRLYQRLNELELQLEPDEDTLEDLFLTADRIGKKYQSREEIDRFNQKLAAGVEAIADIVDRQFPEPETDFVDYSQSKAQTKAATKRRRR